VTETPVTPDTFPVTDHRQSPRGVLPRGMQTWLMAGLALRMVVIMFAIGRPDPPARPTATATTPIPSAGCVRDYQERLKATEARAALGSQAGSDRAGPVRADLLRGTRNAGRPRIRSLTRGSGASTKAYLRATLCSAAGQSPSVLTPLGLGPRNWWRIHRTREAPRSTRSPRGGDPCE
jgi:hypothetical protein